MSLYWHKDFFSFRDLFHKHVPICTSREFIGHGTKYSHVGGFVEIDPTNIYLTEGYCLTCGKKFTGRQEVYQAFDRPQPYDEEITCK